MAVTLIMWLIVYPLALFVALLIARARIQSKDRRRREERARKSAEDVAKQWERIQNQLYGKR